MFLTHYCLKNNFQRAHVLDVVNPELKVCGVLFIGAKLFVLLHHELCSIDLPINGSSAGVIFLSGF